MDAPSQPDRGSGMSCPTWCGRAHGAGDHPDDRHHTSPPRLVALVTGNPVLEPDDHAHAVSAVLRLVRRTESGLTWVEVVSEEGQEVRLVVTTESARRLVTTLHGLLAEAGA
jgi:hypothetical protein